MRYIKFSEEWIDETNYFKLFSNIFSKKDKNKGEIKFWLLEINSSGEVTKEIAIGENDLVISYAPHIKNRGEWVDSNILLFDQNYEEVDRSHFYRLWNPAVLSLTPNSPLQS